MKNVRRKKMSNSELKNDLLTSQAIDFISLWLLRNLLTNPHQTFPSPRESVRLFYNKIQASSEQKLSLKNSPQATQGKNTTPKRQRLSILSNLEWIRLRKILLLTVMLEWLIMILNYQLQFLLLLVTDNLEDLVKK